MRDSAASSARLSLSRTPFHYLVFSVRTPRIRVRMRIRTRIRFASERRATGDGAILDSRGVAYHR